MTRDSKRHDPAALATAMEADAFGVDARPARKHRQAGAGVVGVRGECLLGCVLARVAAGRGTLAALVVGEHRKAEARVQANPEVVVVALARLRTMHNDNARMRSGALR